MAHDAVTLALATPAHTAVNGLECGCLWENSVAANTVGADVATILHMTINQLLDDFLT